MKRALVAGATGLVGGELLKILLDRPEYGRIVALVRRRLPLEHPKLEQRVIDFDRMADHADAFAVDDVYCCLGTTIKKAGSQAAQRLVDYEYPLAMARLAKAQGARRYLLVSSAGADAKSAFFYMRLKGEVEAAISGVGLPEVHIFRPSLLLGQRQEMRFGERVAIALSPLYGPLMPPSSRPIQAHDVAQAMVVTAVGPEAAGVHIHPNQEVQQLARR